MSTSAGPNIVEDGLVLSLDAANFKSFKGEPTTNLISDPFCLSGNPGGFYWGFEATSVRTNLLPYSKMNDISPYWIKVELTNSGGTGRVSTISLPTLETGVDYCFSAYVYSNDTNITSVRLNTHNSSVSTDVSKIIYQSSDVGSVKRIQTIFRSVSGSNLEVLQMSPSNVLGTTFYITGFQIEKKSYPTPVVNGTRGNTVATGGGWADLSGIGNNGELVNGVSYDGDSSGSLVFDGVNDYIITPSTTIPSSQTFSIWASVGTDTPNTPAGILVQHDHISKSNFGINHVSGNKLAPSIGYVDGTREFASKRTVFSPTVNSTFNAVLVYNHNENKIYWYINGKLDSSYELTNTPLLTSHPIGLGRWNPNTNAYYFNGKIYYSLIHNKSLTEEEIKQNFNALRGRYGI